MGLGGFRVIGWAIQACFSLEWVRFLLHVIECSSANNYSPPEVDRIWLWVYYNKIPLYPMFYLLKGTIYLKLHHVLKPCKIIRKTKRKILPGSRIRLGVFFLPQSDLNMELLVLWAPTSYAQNPLCTDSDHVISHMLFQLILLYY